jgi:hypothetical protein
MELESRRPDGPVFRLGRRPDAWQPPDWFLAHSDGTFGNRFDDPEGYYRVLYASSQRLGCFVETLARFRPDLSLLAELSAIEGADDFLPLGTLPRDWLAVRMVGKAKIDGVFADLYAVSWVSHLRRSLAAEALRLGVNDIDLSTLENAEPRRLTQLASRQAYQLQYRTGDGWQDIPLQQRTPGKPLANGENRIEFPAVSMRELRIALTNPPAPARFRLIEIKAFAP